MTRFAEAYAEIIDEEDPKKFDGRRKREPGRTRRGNRPVPQKGALSLMLSGKRGCTAKTAWRWGRAAARLGVPSSGLEAQLASGHRAEVVAVVGLLMKRWFIDVYDRSDYETQAVSLQYALITTAACAVDEVLKMPDRAVIEKLSEYSDALTETWQRWLRAQDPQLLWTFYHAAYVLLDGADGDTRRIGAARTILTYEDYEFGAPDWLDEDAMSIAAGMYLEQDNPGPWLWLSTERFEATARRNDPHHAAASALLGGTPSEAAVKLSQTILSLDDESKKGKG